MSRFIEADTVFRIKIVSTNDISGERSIFYHSKSYPKLSTARGQRTRIISEFVRYPISNTVQEVTVEVATEWETVND